MVIVTPFSGYGDFTEGAVRSGKYTIKDLIDQELRNGLPKNYAAKPVKDNFADCLNPVG